MRLAASRQALAVRSRALQSVRGFFAGRDFLEIETPVRLPVPALEAHIDAEPAGEWYLRTSPEFHLKRLLAAGHERVYELGACFRRGERGALHNPEYTMLEWYRAGAGYEEVLGDCRALLETVAVETLGTTRVSRGPVALDLAGEWEVLTVRDAYRRFAGWDPHLAYDADRFDLDMADKVEPSLPRSHPVVLIDYPIQAAALARCRAGLPPVAERWELYVAGVELANAFGELTDAAEQRRRFTQWAAERARRGQPAYPADEEFLAALEMGLPPSAGVALGIDRLVMLLAGAESIDAVRAFA